MLSPPSRWLGKFRKLGEPMADEGASPDLVLLTCCLQGRLSALTLKTQSLVQAPLLKQNQGIKPLGVSYWFVRDGLPLPQ